MRLIPGRLRRLAARDWLILFGAIVAAIVVGVASYVVVDAARVRSQTTQQAQAQRDQAIDARKAQTRRIDQLTEQLQALETRARAQASLVGRQEQAIRDLAEQVSRGGQEPVATAVSPRRTSTRTPAPSAGTKPTTAPKPPATARPALATTTDDGLLCSLLVLVC